MKTKKEFRLDKWLENKEQKIVTGNNLSVTILTYERKDTKYSIDNGTDYPIVALISSPVDTGDFVELYNKNGFIKDGVEGKKTGINQLYIVEDATIEFKKELAKAIDLSRSFDRDVVVDDVTPNLIEIIRKAIEADLPKWKVCEDVEPDLTKGSFIMSSGDNPSIIKDGYEIFLKDLETLPHE